MADVAEIREDNPETAYEPKDWRIGLVGLIFLGIFAVLVIAPLALMWAYPNSLSDVIHGELVEPPQPRLQTNPPRDLASFRTAEDRKLNTYYWTDKAKGLVHIPIAEAMKKVAKEGLPGFPKGGS